MFWCLVCDIPHSTSPCTGHCPLLHTYTPYTLCTSRFEFSCLRGGLCGNKKAKVASNTSLPTLARIMLAERGDFHWQQKNERNSPIHWESDRGQGSPWVTGGRDIPCSPQQDSTFDPDSHWSLASHLLWQEINSSLFSPLPRIPTLLHRSHPTALRRVRLEDLSQDTCVCIRDCFN